MSANRLPPPPSELNRSSSLLILSGLNPKQKPPRGKKKPARTFIRPRSDSDTELTYLDTENYNDKARLQKFFEAVSSNASGNNIDDLSQTMLQDAIEKSMVFSIALMSLPVYIVGSAGVTEMGSFLGIEYNEYVVGAAYANYVQNILYADCFVKATRNFKNEDKLLLAWSIFWGLITAYVPTAAMYRMGFRKNYNVSTTFILTGMTLISSGQLSFFTMYETTKRVGRIFFQDNNSRARLFALDQLRHQVANDPRKLSFLADHSNGLVENIGIGAGIILAISQVLSIYPWVCDSEQSLESLGLIAAWLLSIMLFNCPNITIAATFSGFDQGVQMANDGHTLSRYVTGEETYYGDFKETMWRIGWFLAMAFTFRECTYSGVTSSQITIDECPSFGSVVDFLLLANVNYGTIWGNFVLCMFTINMIFLTRDHLSDMRAWVETAPIEEVEKLLEEHYQDSINEWKRPKPAANPQHRFLGKSGATLVEINEDDEKKALITSKNDSNNNSVTDTSYNSCSL